MKLKALLGSQNYKVEMDSGKHQIFADEPESIGGMDTAAAPNELLLSALAACTSITLRMYADRKEWKLGEIQVDLSITKTGGNYVILKKISFENTALDVDQLKRLYQIADKCPINKMLSNGVEIKNAYA